MALSSGSPGWPEIAFTAGARLVTKEGMARQRDIVFEGFHGRTDSSAGVVAQYHDQRRSEHRDCIFHTRNRVAVGEVPRHAAYKQIASATIKGIFRRDA